MLDHEVQEPECTFPVQQKIFVHDEERPDFHLAFELAHDLEEFVTRLVKVDELSFPSEHRRGRTEIASHGTSHGRDERCGLLIPPVPDWQAHRTRADTSYDVRVTDRLALVFRKEQPHPSHAFTPHDVISIDPCIQARHVRNVPAYYDSRAGVVLAHQLAHLFDLAYIYRDGADANDVVVVGSDLLDEAIEGLESAEGFLRRQLGRTLHLRRIPEMRFVADHTLEHARKIEDLLDEALGDDRGEIPADLRDDGSDEGL